MQRLAAGEEGAVVLDRTPFYAESGGQVGDRGILRSDAGARFIVADTRKSGDAHLHAGRCESGAIAVGDTLTAEVDAKLRTATVLNHSATHLLHAALRQVLGSHVTQKGSLVAPDRLRFDFSHYEAVTPGQLAAIEDLVNAEIRANAEAKTGVMSYDDAIAAGAMALFGEKYGDKVRVLSIGGFSTELCGGTHVRRAGDIGLFRSSRKPGIAAGIRRIEAVTGDAALARVGERDDALDRIAGLFRGSRADAENRVRQALERTKSLEREIQQLKAKLASGAGSDATAEAAAVAGIKVLARRLDDGIDQKTLRDTVDRFRDRLGSAVVVLASVDPESGKVAVAVGVSKDLTGRVRAGELANAVAAARRQGRRAPGLRPGRRQQCRGPGRSAGSRPGMGRRPARHPGLRPRRHWLCARPWRGRHA